MKFLCFMIITFFGVQTGLNAQFALCNSNTTQNLNDVYFINQQTGIAVGDSGTIIRSTDGGLSWTTIMGIDSIVFSKVRFFNQSVGLAIGSAIYRTADGGITWQHHPHPNVEFTDLEMIDQNTCVLTGVPLKIIKSTNQGQSFTTLVGDTATNNFGLLSFVNDSIGFSCGYYQGYSTKTLKTKDGGITWTHIEDTVHGFNPTVMMAMSFISEQIGFKAGWYNPHLQKTTIGGYEWNNCTSPDSLFDPQLMDLHIEPNMPNNYFACGWYGNVYQSTDGGNSWTLLNSNSITTNRLNGIFFTDNSHGWVVGSGGVILKYQSTIDVEEYLSPIEITIYPNPSNGIVIINGVDISNGTIVDVYNLHANLLERIQLQRTDLNLSHLPDGVYLLRVITDHSECVERWVKQ